MSFGKAKKQSRNVFKKKLSESLKIAEYYKTIEDDKVYDFKGKPSLKGSELKEIFKSKYKWL